MVIRQELPSDTEAVRHLVTLAFGDPAVAELVERIRQSDRYVPELSLVAEVDGEIAGHVMLSHVDLEAAQRRRILCLSPLAVAPARQRMGIGTALVEAGLEMAAGRGEPLVIVEGDPNYYARFGFETSSPHGLIPPAGVPDHNLMVRLLLPPADHPGYRGQVRYSPAFDGL